MEALRAALKNNREVALDAAALDIATIEYPGLAPTPYLSALDAIARDVAECMGHAPDGLRFVEACNRCLFEKLGFRGNQQDYYDVRNSCLNDVLDRKLGIPITLAVVYMEVARRLRRPVFGIGLPGHFVLQYDDDAYSAFIDPFHEGALLSLDDTHKPVSNRYILIRMLNNLRSAYFRVRQYPKVITVLNLQIEASPDTPDYYRDRGVAHMQLHEFMAARRDFGTYLQLSPGASDREKVTNQIEAIHRWLASLN